MNIYDTYILYSRPETTRKDGIQKVPGRVYQKVLCLREKRSMVALAMLGIRTGKMDRTPWGAPAHKAVFRFDPFRVCVRVASV